MQRRRRPTPASVDSSVTTVLDRDCRVDCGHGEIIADAGPFSHSTLLGSNSSRQRGSVRSATASTCALRLSSLAAGGREAVSKAVELLRIDGMDAEAPLHEALHHGAIRNFDGDAHGIWRGPGCLLN